MGLWRETEIMNSIYQIKLKDNRTEYIDLDKMLHISGPHKLIKGYLFLSIKITFQLFQTPVEIELFKCSGGSDCKYPNTCEVQTQKMVDDIIKAWKDHNNSKGPF